MAESESKEVINAFSAFETPLETGVNLIEASAGTGKTFSIAMLVLRFVVEQKLSIEQVLVVTFTKAATQELRSRIRCRLQDLRHYLLDPSQAGELDEAFTYWADQLDNPDEVVTLVTQALAAIDNAAIFTIHGFCQRMLRQYALESGQLFDAELNTNLNALQQSLAEDFWRQQLYAASSLKASLLSSSFTTPQALANSIRAIDTGMLIVPEKQDIDDLIEQIKAGSAILASCIDQDLMKPLTELIAKAPAYFKPAFLAAFEHIQRAISSWCALEGAEAPFTALQALGFDQLLDALNGTKFRGTKLLTSEERKLTFLADGGISELAVLEELLGKTKQLTIALRLGLFDFIQDNLDHKKNDLNVLSYDDLISRLSKAIGDADNLLTASLRGQFAVALIDEFQDTDQQQWNIFSGLYNTPEHYLYLIGDPKQAVYKFRGADIYSYLDAKKAASRAYTLEKNYRSAPVLLEAVNFLYSKSTTPFLLEAIPYYAVKAGKACDETWAGGKKPQGLVLWYLEDNPEHAAGYWTNGIAKNAIRGAVINETVHLLQIQHDAGEPSLRPQDIAILVRGNEEAANYQSALQQAKVPAVINSKSSVFDCDEAIYLKVLLMALERPADLQRLRQALVLPWFGLNGQAFDALCRDDFALQRYVMAFQDFQQRWQEKGLMAMMKSLLDHYQILQTLSLIEFAERRITNLQHLLEIIQQVVLDQRLDTHKTLEWLSHAIQGEHRGEGTELRLEQDEDAVNIVTIHSAKGLEYPVVFVPELWSERKGKSTPSAHDVVICHKEGQLIADLGSSDIDEHFEQAQFEEQAEELRLLYVAITRAASRCYLPWATSRSAKKDNQSAFAYLLKPHEGEDWQARLSNLSESVEGIEFDIIPAKPESLQLSVSNEIAINFQARVAERSIQQRWRMSSYSSLAYLSQHEHELPQDKSQEPVEAEELTTELVVAVLPKGAHTGNVLHDLLENHCFKQLSNLPNDTHYYEGYVASCAKSCTRYGLVLEPEMVDVLDQLLVRSVQAPLDADDLEFYLANIDDRDCLKEMAFYFSINELQTSAINQLLASEPSYQPLSTRQISGQLTGFIDLICQYQGRYYVMDYKSNSLPEYNDESLQRAMREHNYGLQYFIYSLVLHHYLQQRLPDYQYETHFGGVRYLFLRGMDRAHPMQGVFVDKPSSEIIEGLSKIFNGGGV